METDLGMKGAPKARGTLSSSLSPTALGLGLQLPCKLSVEPPNPKLPLGPQCIQELELSTLNYPSGIAPPPVPTPQPLGLGYFGPAPWTSLAQALHKVQGGCPFPRGTHKSKEFEWRLDQSQETDTRQAGSHIRQVTLDTSPTSLGSITSPIKGDNDPHLAKLTGHHEAHR